MVNKKNLPRTKYINHNIVIMTTKEPQKQKKNDEGILSQQQEWKSIKNEQKQNMTNHKNLQSHMKNNNDEQ